MKKKTDIKYRFIRISDTDYQRLKVRKEQTKIAMIHLIEMALDTYLPRKRAS